jgi:hypothetical protein
VGRFSRTIRPTHGYEPTRDRDGGVRQELAAGMTKKRRVYKPRCRRQVMMPADLKRLHKYMLEIEGIRP